MSKEKYTRVMYTELHEINRERFRHLGDKAENVSCFVTYILPSSGDILAKTRKSCETN